MTYLMEDFRGIREYENFDDVVTALKVAVAHWIYTTDEDDDVPETVEELFNHCMNKKDFGNIADVFEVNVYFTVNNKIIPSNLSCCEKDKEFKIKRIL